MNVTTTAPVNLRQLQAQLGGTGTLRCQGNPTAGSGGAVLSSSQYTDAEISDAIAAVTYDATYGEASWRATLSSLSSAASAGTLDAAQIQEAIAALIAAVNP